MTDFITETLQEINATGVAHCQLCPEDDDEVDVENAESFGDVLDAMYDHGVEEHGLPEDEPWGEAIDSYAGDDE